MIKEGPSSLPADNSSKMNNKSRDLLVRVRYRVGEIDYSRIQYFFLPYMIGPNHELCDDASCPSNDRPLINDEGCLSRGLRYFTDIRR